MRPISRHVVDLSWSHRLRCVALKIAAGGGGASGRETTLLFDILIGNEKLKMQGARTYFYTHRDTGVHHPASFSHRTEAARRSDGRRFL